MKLGFLLKITDQGEREAHSINREKTWADHIPDARDAINRLTGFDKTGKRVYLLRFFGKVGYLLGVIQSTTGRRGDNSAAWIYVPCKAKISGEELEEVLHQVEQSAFADKGMDKDELREIFNKKYDEKDVFATAVEEIESKPSGQEATYALRYYGSGCDHSLSELLGDYLAQKEYAEYNGILLVNTASEIGPNGTVRPLDSDLIQTVTIEPPEAEGFAACIQRGEKLYKFDKCIEAPRGQKIIVHWKPNDEHYAPIEKTYTAGDDLETFTIEDADRRIRIRREWFCVKGKEDGKNLSELGHSAIKITVNGKDYPLQERGLDVAESAVKKGIGIKVTADDYKEYTGKLLLQPEQPKAASGNGNGANASKGQRQQPIRSNGNRANTDENLIYVLQLSSPRPRKKIILHRCEFKYDYTYDNVINCINFPNDPRVTIETAKITVSVTTKGTPKKEPEIEFISPRQKTSQGGTNPPTTRVPQPANNNSTTSPQGAKSGNGNRQLEKNRSLKDIALGCVLGALFVLLCGGIWWVWDNNKSEWKKEVSWLPFGIPNVVPKTEVTGSAVEAQVGVNDTPASVETSIDTAGLSQAILYLDKYDNWHKDSLELYNATKGLYDELNDFRTENIEKRVNQWESNKSERLQEVLAALQENHNNRFDPHKGKEANGGKYNPQTDSIINVNKYKNWLKYKHEPQSHSQDYRH